jgi:DNA-binding MarR family transcriptional regulator
VIQLPASKYKRFTEHSQEGREFTKMWNSADRDGIQNELAKHFNISVSTVVRIRRELKLPRLHDAKNHPGKRKLYKRIKKMYLNRELSTSYIGKVVKMCDQNVNHILKQQNIELRPQHITNVAYIKTSSHLTPTKLLTELKKLYCDEKLPAKHIADKLGIDQGTVRAKLKSMGIHVEHRKIIKEQIVVVPNYNIKGIYQGISDPFSVICYQGSTVTHKGRSIEKRSRALCQWCKTDFPQYIDKGPRTQLYC